MNRDQELITKERARNAVRHVFGQGLVEVLAAIDAIPAIPQAEDAVSRKKVQELLGWRLSPADRVSRAFADRERKIVIEGLAQLPSVLPAPGRSEDKPDYKAMWKGLKMYVRDRDDCDKKEFLDIRDRIRWLETRHTKPGANMSRHVLTSPDEGRKDEGHEVREKEEEEDDL